MSLGAPVNMQHRILQLRFYVKQIYPRNKISFFTVIKKRRSWPSSIQAQNHDCMNRNQKQKDKVPQIRERWASNQMMKIGESNNLIESVVEFLNMKDKILSHCFTNHLPAQFQPTCPVPAASSNLLKVLYDHNSSAAREITPLK